MLKKDRGGDQQRLDKIKKEFKVDESEKEVGPTGPGLEPFKAQSAFLANAWEDSDSIRRVAASDRPHAAPICIGTIAGTTARVLII